jgi:hypothetical protein
MAEPSYYGAPSQTDNKTLGERLRDYYDPEDFVTVQNVDSKPLSYQFMDPKNEQFFQAAPHLSETVQSKPPIVETLQPGQTKLCPAFEADRMLETLIKQITSSKTSRLIAEGKYQPWQSANWSDPRTQKSIIEEAFLGKEDLIGNYNKSQTDTKRSVTKDLELEETSESEPKFPDQTSNPIEAVPNEQPRRPGRPPRAANTV